MISFDRYGHGERKLLGLHGWFGDERTFKPLEHSLDPGEVECAWLAHRGYGASRDVQGRYDMAEMAADAIAVANSLGWSSFSVIGHSMGGKAAQLVAASAPERVEKLILVAPVSADPVPFEPSVRELFGSAAESADTRRAIIDGSTAGRLSRLWVNRLVAASMAGAREEAFAAYFRSWADDDFADRINNMGVATLVLAGAQDPVITAQVCEYGFRQRYRDLVIKELQNSGHYPVDEIPLLVGAEVDAHLLGKLNV